MLAVITLIMSPGKPVHSLLLNICNGTRAEVEPGHDKGARGEPAAGNRLGGEGVCRSVHCSANPKCLVGSASCKSVPTCFALYTAADLLAISACFISLWSPAYYIHAQADCGGRHSVCPFFSVEFFVGVLLWPLGQSGI